MNRTLLISLFGLALAPVTLAQTAPLDRAEILGELAEGQSASYLAHRVQSQGISFTATADFLDRVRLSGGQGILTERLAAADPPANSSPAKNERSVDHLAKCSELIHVGAMEQAGDECRAAVDENPESAWPTMLLLRVLSESGIAPEERVQLLRNAVARDPHLVNAHRALAMADIASQERTEEIEKVAALERAQPAEAYRSIDASVFDRGFSQSTMAGNLSMDKQKQLRAQIDASLHDYPDLAAVRLAAGFAYVILGELENGQTQIREALRLEPGNPELHLALGHFYQSQHQVEAEFAEYRTAARLVAYQNLPRRYLTEAMVRERRPQEAIQEWKDFLMLSPRDLQASASLVTLYVDQHNRPAAIEEIRRSLKASSDVASSEADFVNSRLNDLDRLAHLLTDNGEFDAAAQQYAYLLRIKPDDSVLHNNLGNVFYAQRQCTEAIREYREALRLASDWPDAHHNLANCLLVARQTDEAIAEYRQTLELDPTRTYSRAMLGVALTNKGELNSAIEQFELYLSETPNDVDVLANLAHAHYLNKDYGSAITELKRALTIKPEFPTAENQLAWIYATADDPRFQNPDDALRLARHVVQNSHPPVPEFLDTLAEALLQNGDTTEALRTEEQAAQLASTNSEIQNRLPRFRAAVQSQTASNP